MLDVRLPDGDGIELCREVRSRHPEVVCLILTAYDDDEATMSAVLAGASGYVLKNVSGTRLVEDIRAVASRAIPAPPGSNPPRRRAGCSRRPG